MNSRDFTFWLHGFFEISAADVLTPSQVQEIKNHLSLVNKNKSTEFSWYPENLRQENINRKSTGLPQFYC